MKERAIRQRPSLREGLIMKDETHYKATIGRNGNGLAASSRPNFVMTREQVMAIDPKVMEFDFDRS